MDNRTASQNLSSLLTKIDKDEKSRTRLTIFLEGLTLLGIFAIAYFAFIMFV